MTTGDRIRYYRKLNNMTMVELAQKIGVKHSAIYKYETGRVTNIPVENINKMAYAFNIPARYLIDWISDDPTPELDLNADEQNIITVYRQLSDENRNAVKSYLNFILSTQGEQK